MSDRDLMSVVKAFLDKENWRYQHLSDVILNMAFSGKNGRWVCYAQVRAAQEQIVFYSVLPSNVPENRRHHIAEFITRANYGMVIGNFEMDFNDGELRYKTSIDFENMDTTCDLVPLMAQIVYSNVLMMDKYFNGIMSVIYGSELPAEAIYAIENLSSGEQRQNTDSKKKDDDSGPLH